MINNLSDHTVEIDIRERGMEKSYCGSGNLLSTLGLKLNGLEYELNSTYEYLR